MRAYRSHILIVLFFLMINISACNSDWFVLPTATPAQPTVTPSETPEPTQTRVWFPATETNTPLPGSIARTATPDLRPLGNDIILRDDFSDGQPVGSNFPLLVCLLLMA